MKNIFLVFILTLFIFNVNAAKITDDDLLIGRPGSAADKLIKTSDGGFLKKVLGGDWFFSNDGLLEKKIGSGAGTGGSGGVNILTNSSFEDGLTDWTNTGGTLTQETYTNGLEGNLKYARFVATAAGQYFEVALITKPDEVGLGCMARLSYLQGDNAFEYKVFDSVGEISTGTLSDLTIWTDAPIQTFDCKSQLKLRVISTAAGTIDVDKIHLGANLGVMPISEGNISDWTDAGLMVISATTTAPTKGTATVDKMWWRRVGSNMEVRFEYKQTGVGGAGSGDYLFQIPSGFLIDTTKITPYSVIEGAGVWANFNTVGSATLSDNTTSHHAMVSVYDNQYVRMMQISDGSDGVNGSAYTPISQAGYHLTAAFTVPIQGWTNNLSGKQTYTPEQASFYINLSVGGANITMVNNATPGEITNASLDMVLNRGSAKIPCSTTNASTGLTCSAGNEALGVVFNAPVSGRYKVCASFSLESGGGTNIFRWVETIDSSQVIINQGNGVAGHSASPSSIRICDHFDFNSTGEKVLRLFNGGNGTNQILADRTAGQFDRDINITVELVSNFANRPIIQNMVDTKVSSGIRIETCRINNNGTASKGGNTDLCDWLGTPVRASAGTVDNAINVGVFSGEPSCFFMTLADTTDQGRNARTISPTNIRTVTYDSASSAIQDRDYFLTCIGAR